MYCKSTRYGSINGVARVLIVAKCIVNNIFNNSKTLKEFVLIVAKCIVNNNLYPFLIPFLKVLIVAKCIVNNTY